MRRFNLIVQGDGVKEAFCWSSKFCTTDSIDCIPFPQKEFSNEDLKKINSGYESVVIVYSNDNQIPVIRKLVPEFDIKKYINIIHKSGKVYVIIKTDEQHTFEKQIEELMKDG